MQIFHTLTIFTEERFHRFEEWKPGVQSLRSSFPARFEAPSPQGAVWEHIRFFNQDNRPNGHTERSVSRGDVIAVRISGQPTLYFEATGYAIRELTAEEVNAHNTVAINDATGLVAPLAGPVLPPLCVHDRLLRDCLICVHI